jgi:hypothetical protein
MSKEENVEIVRRAFKGAGTMGLEAAAVELLIVVDRIPRRSRSSAGGFRGARPKRVVLPPRARLAFGAAT